MDNNIKQKNLKEGLFSFSSLYYAYLSCLSGKVNKSSSIKFEENLEKNLLKMSVELKNKTYTPGPFTCFAISEPKLREVWAADFKDRVLHHLLVSEIEPIWEKIFIHDSYACRKWKGAHKAIFKIKKILKYQKNLYYLHVDVKGFFTNINKDVLYKIISKKIKSPDILYLSKMIIFHDPRSNYTIKGNEKLLHSIPPHKSLFGAPDDRGLPIGNYTSQFFANIYLNELDQYAKRTLKCHYYFRYMDDVIILSSNQKYLSGLIKKIDLFLNEKLKLELHPKKTTLQKCEYGIDALGYIIHPEYTLSRKRIVGNVREKLIKYNKKLYGITDTDKIKEIVMETQAVINSYWGHFKHADCGNLRKKLYENHFGELKKYLIKSKNEGHLVVIDGVFPKKKKHLGLEP